jgi:Protein of unknown function (DUF1168)
MSNPDIPVDLPPPTTSNPKNSVKPPPEIVPNVQGSSAGARSGEFHVYKASRRREYERIRGMEEEAMREKEDEEWERRERDQREWEKKRERRRKKEGRVGREVRAIEGWRWMVRREVLRRVLGVCRRRSRNKYRDRQREMEMMRSKMTLTRSMRNGRKMVLIIRTDRQSKRTMG